MNDRPQSHLEIADLTMRFGGILAVDRVSLDVRPAEIHSIIGPNGAGKTTLFNCISGIYRARSGSIRLEGKEIMGMKPHKISQMGIARAFQNIELFMGMTVLDNMMSAQGHLQDYGLLRAALYLGRCLEEETGSRDRVEETGVIGRFVVSVQGGLDRQLLNGNVGSAQGRADLGQGADTSGV